jgi:peptidoglycan hydrolase-like protein with peptidoglycan-binding domain
MRIYLAIALSLFLPIFAFAATDDFVANGNITVKAVTFGGSTADMIIFNGSTAESWTFNSGAFTVTNPGSAFKVGSSDSSVKSVKISSSSSVLVCTENTTPGTSYATLPNSSGTYIVEPSSITDCTTLCTTLSNTATYNSYPTCGAASCNAGFRLSGSGSGATCASIGAGGIILGPGGLSAPTIPPQPLTPVSAVAKVVSPIFNITLRYGITSDEVKRLQELLASDPELYPEGIVSGWFGSLTRKAVQKFQCKHNIVCSGDENTTGYGLLGPKTRAKLAEVFAKAEPKAPEVAKPSPVAISVSPVFTIGLGRGITGSDVKRLQQLLNSDPDTQIASSGVGSPGNETEYFGTLTEKAVQKFQLKHGLAQEGDPGYGYVGPKTRTKMQEVFKKE